MVACFKPVKLSRILFEPLYTHTAMPFRQKVKFLLKGEKKRFSQFVTYCKTTEHLKFNQKKIYNVINTHTPFKIKEKWLPLIFETKAMHILTSG